ncbi:MAG: DsrE family protein [Opitutaceae bacterium]|nr:DsrE family protein [Opitutaceae bacterium]
MKKLLTIACLFAATLLPSPCPAAEKAALPAPKAKILVHLAQGPENPTRAALAFLVAKTALAEGHHVSLFLAGDAVQLVRDPVLDNLAGLGTGKLREHFDAIVKAGGRFYLSGGSSKARGVTEADLKGKAAEFATPEVLLHLSLGHDRMFTY